MTHIPPILLTKLQDPDPEVREFALDEIGTLNPSNALEIICPFLSDEEAEVRASAACNLGEIQNEKAVPHLIRVARQDTDQEVRFQALSALESYHTPEIFNYLIHEAYHGQELRMLRQTVAHQLGDYDHEEAVDALLSLLQDDDPHVLIPTVDSLFKLNRPRLKKVWQKVLLASFHPYLVQIAAQALANLEESALFDVVSPFVANNDPKVREGAAYALGAIHDQRAISCLLKLAQKDSAQRVRDMSILALSEYRAFEIAFFLVYSLYHEPLSERARESIAEQLRFYDSPKSINALMTLLEDREEVVRLTATHSLRYLTSNNGRGPYNASDMSKQYEKSASERFTGSFDRVLVPAMIG